MPQDFSRSLPIITGNDIWFPIRVPLTSDNPSNGGLLCLGLLKPDATPQQAEASLTPPLAALRQRFPAMFVPGERVHLVPLREFVAAGAGTAPLLLFGAVMLVLLIACVNVANLLLAAAAGRRHEMALRAAVGASRGRMVRQLLTESLLLSVIGGIVGVGACAALFGTIARLLPPDIPRVGEFRIDAAVLAFALLMSVATGVLFGLVPAFSTSAVDVNSVLKTGGARTVAGGHALLRRVLAANELALSLVLLVGAALALQSLSRLMNVQPGFDSSSLLTFQVDLPAKKYNAPDKRQAFFDQALSRFAALPGVEHAAATSLLPFVGGWDTLFTIEDGGAQPGGDKFAANFRIVSPDYFRAFRIPQERGRMFGDADRQGNLPVVLINRAAATAYWPNSNPLGTHVWIGKPMGPENSEPAPRQVIGIVGDIHESSLADPPEPTLYIPLAQNPSTDSAAFVLRTSRPPIASVPDARAALRDIDPDLPMSRVQTMDDVVAQSVRDWRFRALLLGSFGALALFIAAIGVYGVISYSVAQRTQEIGVRVALGADRRSVLGLILRQGMITAVVGIGIGLVAAFALTRVMANLLFGVNARDPLTFAGVAILLGVVAAAACMIPARRAMRVDPMVALRYE
jgi:predicted permease